jgi:hypothetical protein
MQILPQPSHYFAAIIACQILTHFGGLKASHLALYSTIRLPGYLIVAHLKSYSKHCIRHGFKKWLNFDCAQCRYALCRGCHTILWVLSNQYLLTLGYVIHGLKSKKKQTSKHLLNRVKNMLSIKLVPPASPITLWNPDAVP